MIVLLDLVPIIAYWLCFAARLRGSHAFVANLERAKTFVLQAMHNVLAVSREPVDHGPTHLASDGIYV